MCIEEALLIKRFYKYLLGLGVISRPVSINDRLNGGIKYLKEVPIWEKSNLTVEEAAAYSGIGINKLKEITNEDDCPFVLWVGKKRLIKRKKFDNYIENCYSI